MLGLQGAMSCWSLSRSMRGAIGRWLKAPCSGRRSELRPPLASWNLLRPARDATVHAGCQGRRDINTRGVVACERCSVSIPCEGLGTLTGDSNTKKGVMLSTPRSQQLGL